MERYELLSSQSLHIRIQCHLIKHTVTCIISALEVFAESKRKSDHALVTHLRLSARSNNEVYMDEIRYSCPTAPVYILSAGFNSGLFWFILRTTRLRTNKTYKVYLSQYLTNLMHKICFTISFISCLYMFRAHVLIIRR